MTSSSLGLRPVDPRPAPPLSSTTVSPHRFGFRYELGETLSVPELWDHLDGAMMCSTVAVVAEPGDACTSVLYLFHTAAAVAGHPVTMLFEPEPGEIGRTGRADRERVLCTLTDKRLPLWNDMLVVAHIEAAGHYPAHWAIHWLHGASVLMAQLEKDDAGGPCLRITGVRAHAETDVVSTR